MVQHDPERVLRILGKDIATGVRGQPVRDSSGDDSGLARLLKEYPESRLPFAKIVDPKEVRAFDVDARDVVFADIDRERKACSRRVVLAGVKRTSDFQRPGEILRADTGQSKGDLIFGQAGEDRAPAAGGAGRIEARSSAGLPDDVLGLPRDRPAVGNRYRSTVVQSQPSTGDNLA